MAYSMDPNENRENAISPSVFTMTEQLLYKIAALDASVQSGFRRIDEKMDRFQTDLHDSQIATNDRINALDKELNESMLRKRARLDNVEKSIRENHDIACKKISEVETWQKILTARMTLAAGAIVAIWTFVAPAVRSAFGLGN